MEKREMENGTGTEAIEKSWDTDNLRLGIFLILFTIWAPFQFIPLASDPLCKGKETLYCFTFPLMCLALFLSRRRSPQIMRRLVYLTLYFAGIGLAYHALAYYHQLPPWLHMPFMAAGFYFVKERSSAVHVKNIALGVWIILILDYASTNNPHNPDFFFEITAISAGFIVLKYKEGLLRPALFFLMLVTSHVGWLTHECPRASGARCTHAKSDLANLAIAEEEYFKSHKVYLKNQQVFINEGSFRPTKNVSIVITYVDDTSFRLMAFHRFCDQNEDGAPDFFYWDSANGGMQYP